MVWEAPFCLGLVGSSPTLGEISITGLGVSFFVGASPTLGDLGLSAASNPIHVVLESHFSPCHLSRALGTCYMALVWVAWDWYPNNPIHSFRDSHGELLKTQTGLKCSGQTRRRTKAWGCVTMLW